MNNGFDNNNYFNGSVIKKKNFMSKILPVFYLFFIVGIALTVFYFYNDNYQFYLETNEVNVPLSESYRIALIAKQKQYESNDNYDFESLTPDIVKVSEEGIVTPLDYGIGKIEIKSKKGYNNSELMVNIDDIIVTNLKTQKNVIKNGTSVKIKPIINNDETISTKLKYKSSDSKIAKVSENGEVTGVSEGKAKITVTSESGVSTVTEVEVKKTVVLPSTIKISDESLTLKVGEEEDLSAEITPSNASNQNLTWESSNSKIVKVSEGHIQALKKGKATITVKTINGKEDSCEVEVKETEEIKATNIELDKTSITLKKNETTNINVIFTPRDVTDKTVIWTSNNTKVATVDNKGNIETHDVGEAIITAGSNGLIKEAKITVNADVIDVQTISITNKVSTLNVGDTLKLTTSIKPSNASNKTVTFTSSNSNIAFVDELGNVTAKKNGEVEIRAKAHNGKEAIIKIKVVIPKIEVENVLISKTKATMNIGETLTLAASVLPSDASSRYLSWQSSNSNVARVEDGVVTAVSAGSATITVQSSNGKKNTCIINVNKKNVDVTDILLNNTEITLNIKESANLIATIKPKDATNKTIKWTSDNNNVATVIDGKIVGISAGKTKIKASIGNVYSECQVTVLQEPEKTIEISSITLNKKSLNLKIGDMSVLTATISPNNATNKNIVWSSDKTDIAEVHDGVVEALKEGTATITAKAKNGKEATCKVVITKPEIVATKVVLSNTEAKLYVNDTITLTAMIEPTDASDKKITWSSSDTSIATVSKGTVKALKAGTATITAKSSNGKTDKCKITVSKPAPAKIVVKSISLNKTTLNLQEGDSDTLSVTFTPSDATNKTITWSSSDTSVAIISDGVVKALKEGTTTITAQSNNGKKAVCSVVVKKKNIVVEKISLDVNKKTIKIDESINLTATLTPSNVTNKKVTWSSSDTSIATVYKGTVVGKSAGTTTITAKSNNGKTATATITVTAPTVTSLSLSPSKKTINSGDKVTLKVTINPSNVTDTIQWSSSDKSIATVSNDGTVTGKGVGTAKIEAKSSNGKKATATITVQKAQAKIVTKVATPPKLVTDHKNSDPTEYSSNTLKYKIYKMNSSRFKDESGNEIQLYGNYYLTYLWIKDPYSQIGKRNGNSTISEHVKALLEKDKTYVNKQLIAFNSGCAPYMNYEMTNGNFVVNYNTPGLDKECKNCNDSHLCVCNGNVFGIRPDNTIKSMKVNTDETAMKNKFNEYGFKNTFTIFGSKLVEDGKIIDIKGSSSADPRQAICQLDSNNYVMYTSTYANTSSGAIANNISLKNLAKYMKALGCQNAYNFDGGGSVTMVVKKKGDSVGKVTVAMHSYRQGKTTERGARPDFIFFSE